MARWIPLANTGPGSPTHRCVIHGVDFRKPNTCSVCDAEPSITGEEEKSLGDLPYIPGMPTSIEDERTFRDLSKEFLEKSKSTEVATVAVKFAELALRSLTTAAGMGERRESSWLTEQRQAEIRALAGRRAKRK